MAAKTDRHCNVAEHFQHKLGDVDQGFAEADLVIERESTTATALWNRDGRISMLDYRMPTSLDLPMIDTVMIEVPNPGHPLGVRGVGEASIAPPPAAIADAIYNAVGMRMERLPMNPTTVMEAVRKKVPQPAGR